MIISNLIYTARIIPPYKSHIKEMQSILFGFIKYEKPPGYTYTEMQRPIKEGGFGLPNIELKARAAANMWLHYMHKCPEDQIWLELFRQSMYITPKPEQNSIQHQILATKNKDQINWHTVTMKELYNKFLNHTPRLYEAERNTASTIIWKEIWQKFRQRKVNNIIKVQVHRILTRKLPLEKITNKSGNCCLCDYNFIQSIEHILFNCRGIKNLKKKIKEEYQYEINEDILYEKYSSEHHLNIAYGYIYTIVNAREEHKGKWGTPEWKRMIELWNKNKKWLVID
jgi:hypothetical protein